MVVSFGKHMEGKLLEMTGIALGDSVPGKVYEIHIQTNGVPDAEKAVMILAEKLYDEHKAHTIWAEVDGDTIRLQVIGSPFAWAVLIPFIPAIMGLLGISIVLISVYSVLAAIPSWAYALLAVGVGLILVGPWVGKTITGVR